MSRIPVVLISLCLVLMSCSSPSPTPTGTVAVATLEQLPSRPASSPMPDLTATLPPPAVELAPSEPVPSPPAPSPTPTPTPTPSQLLGPVTQTPTPLVPTGGYIEVRTPNTINMQTECVSIIPFRLVQEGTRTMSRGEGRIDCFFEGKPLGGEDAPIVYHVTLEFDAVLDGELLPATPDRPHGWLDAYLTLDGAIIQYWTGYPSQASNPCPQSSPCRIPTSDVIPLPFAFEEGSTITTPWTFILHLE
jgi:hypothetical protein